MRVVNIVLTRIVQLVISTFFAFALSFYFGGLLLAPLAALMGIADALSQGLGLNTMIGTLLALPVVIVIGYLIQKVPGLVALVVTTGKRLGELVIKTLKEFETNAAQLR